MGEAYFYHLTASTAADTLRLLLPKALAAGWDVALRCPMDMVAPLDDALWQGDGFLPHGVAGGPHDGDQPVLIGPDVAGRACIMSVGGMDVSAPEVTASQRVCLLFDGQDGAAVQHARVQWKTLTGAGCAAQYWSQDGGRWERKA